MLPKFSSPAVLALYDPFGVDVPLNCDTTTNLVMKGIENSLVSKIDDNLYGAIAGVSTTNALVKLTHEWFKVTDAPGKGVRVHFPDYSKAFDLINHDILIRKFQTIGVKLHIVRWMPGFLLE